jgi:hypothetical protein
MTQTTHNKQVDIIIDNLEDILWVILIPSRVGVSQHHIAEMTSELVDTTLAICSRKIWESDYPNYVDGTAKDYAIHKGAFCHQCAIIMKEHPGRFFEFMENKDDYIFNPVRSKKGNE